MLEVKGLQKLAKLINIFFLGCFILGIASFRAYGITCMVYLCIPTLALFATFFYLIRKGVLHVYVALVYTILGIYMAAATVCVGYSAGFHLYCMSLIPLAFYMEYMADKSHVKKMRALPASLILVCVNFACTGYAVLKGPIYHIEAEITARFMYVNALIVFGFLISYGNLMRRLVMDSEDKLADMANTDRLTGLFNRHYMMGHLEELDKDVRPGQWIAMIDIDDFKKINDTHGHSYGDYVLVKLAGIMREACRGCTICRWGGEEFLVISDTEAVKPEVLENLRQQVEQATFSYQDKETLVTVTAGVSCYQEGQTLDNWIQSADAKLYEGKNGEKNCVVY